MTPGILNKAVLACVVFAAAGCAAPKVEPARPSVARAAQASTDALLAEALAAYSLQRDGARTVSLMQAAATQAPNRADIAYMQVALCALIEGCQPEEFEARLRKLDEGNAIVWMGALARAQRQRDEALEAQVLDAIGRSQRFDVYWNQLVSGITLARATSSSGMYVALNETIGWLGTTIVPSLSPITNGCSRKRTAEARWAEICARLATTLANGDTSIAESVGLAIGLQVAADPAERAKLAERARNARYLWQTAGEIINSQIERDKFSAQVVELQRKLRREQDVQLAIVRWSGRPVRPPPDWVED